MSWDSLILFLLKSNIFYVLRGFHIIIEKFFSTDFTLEIFIFIIFCTYIFWDFFCTKLLKYFISLRKYDILVTLLKHKHEGEICICIKKLDTYSTIHINRFLLWVLYLFLRKLFKKYFFFPSALTFMILLSTLK